MYSTVEISKNFSSGKFKKIVTVGVLSVVMCCMDCFESTDTRVHQSEHVQKIFFLAHETIFDEYDELLLEFNTNLRLSSNVDILHNIMKKSYTWLK